MSEKSVLFSSPMIGMTMCSGIGAPEVAAPWVDWRMASEIEQFPRAVLCERFGYKLPEDHNQGEPLLWGDMTEITPDLMQRRGIPLPDLLVAGTPCQAFSIAGLRKGTEDARGNLTLKFVETCHAIVDARPSGTLAVLWENVPGVLSDERNAFGCFLGGLVGAMDALLPTGNGVWPSAGMVSGPRSRAAWRTLDAKFFNLDQRRKRVFVVVDFGNGIDPAEILFERQSIGRPPAPQRPSVSDHTRFFMPGRRAIDRSIAETLGARDYKDPQIVATQEYVRRLLPVEYARLLGFADDHCDIDFNGKAASDRHKYKHFGNSMAVNVIRWILDRLRISWEIKRSTK